MTYGAPYSVPANLAALEKQQSKFLRAILQLPKSASNAAIRLETGLTGKHRDLRDPVPWTLLYADDVMIASESKADLEHQAQVWGDSLTRFGLCLNVK
ncbi:hypothetical protein JRQ81_003460 [Phrynocephalus forsythii]|uniref:Reverse transcriptase domain-containing protein n=1 Tax=Phrynocephalus forsythii TaxID=171643 RepID=A0A9Q0XJW3_9SAUR|nr:hypothetical protein JRQ81_003460 [Phrynocephalus forsythii]